MLTDLACDLNEVFSQFKCFLLQFLVLSVTDLSEYVILIKMPCPWPWLMKTSGGDSRMQGKEGCP